MTRAREGRHGFTLIELLVSLTIFSIIAVAVYSAFAGGVGAWRRAQEFSSTYQTARLVLDDMAHELKNAVTLSGTDFIGEKQGLSFLTVRQRPHAQGRPVDPKITRVTYEVRRDRASATYSLARVEASPVAGSGEDETELVVSPISRLEFLYTYKDDNRDRKSTRLNSSHSQISYAVFCLKKKKTAIVVLASLDRPAMVG